MLWWHCYPPRPPAGLTLAPLTRKATPFDFHRTAFDQWTLPPGCDRSHPGNILKPSLGPTHHKIPSGSNLRRSFPLSVHAVVPSVKGVTLRSCVLGVYTYHHTFIHVRGPNASSGGIATP